MAYAPGAVNRFGFNTADFSYDTPDVAGVFLQPDGTPNQILAPSVACSVSLPNPALCLDQVRRIISLSSANAITVRQFAATLDHSGAVVSLAADITPRSSPPRTR